MGYYATGGGTIAFKNPQAKGKVKQITDLLDQAWMDTMWNKESTEVDFWPEDKYNWELGRLLNEVCKVSSVDCSSAEFHGEDGEHWKFVYDSDSNMFTEIDGRVIYDDECVSPPVDEPHRAEFVGQIIDVFEDFLEAKGVDIENEDKVQSEDPAIIYGMDYGEIQSGIEEIMMRWKVFR